MSRNLSSISWVSAWLTLCKVFILLYIFTAKQDYTSTTLPLPLSPPLPSPPPPPPPPLSVFTVMVESSYISYNSFFSLLYLVFCLSLTLSHWLLFLFVLPDDSVGVRFFFRLVVQDVEGGIKWNTEEVVLFRSKAPHSSCQRSSLRSRSLSADSTPV